MIQHSESFYIHIFYNCTLMAMPSKGIGSFVVFPVHALGRAQVTLGIGY